MKPCPLCKAAVSEAAQFPPDAVTCATCGRNTAQVRHHPTLPPGGVEYSDLAGPAPTNPVSPRPAAAPTMPNVPPMPTVPGMPAPPPYGQPSAQPVPAPMPPPGVPNTGSYYAPQPPPAQNTWAAPMPPPPSSAWTAPQPPPPHNSWTAPQPPPAGPAYGGGWNTAQGMGMVENTSGTKGPIPPEVAKMTWSWGGFGCNCFWLMGHNMLPLGIAWVVLYLLLSVIPQTQLLTQLLNLGGMVYLGMNGNKLAWEYRRFDSIEHFKAVQKAWDMWGITLAILSALALLMMLGALLQPQPQPYVPTYP